MQHNISKHGFAYCGIIYLLSGDELALDTRVRQYNPADFPMRYEIDYVRVFQKE